MTRNKLSRRQFVAATALSSAALVTAPYIRTAHAAGKLTMGFWDHWVPGANKASTDLVNEWAAKEKVEVSIDYITSQGNKNLVDHRRRGAGEIRPRHPGDADLVAARELRTDGTRQRHHGAADQAERRSQRHRQISRSTGRQVARRARLHRQPDQGPLLAYRSDEEIRQYRRAGDVSGRQPAESGQLEHRHLPEGGGGLPQGWFPVRHRARRNLRQCRHRGRLLPGVRRRTGRCQGQPHGQDRCGAPGSRVLQEADRLPAAGRGGVGRCLQQQMAGLRQGRHDHESAQRLGGRQA